MVPQGCKGRGERVGETLRSRPLKEDNKALRAKESRSKKFEKTWNTINSSFSSRQQETMRAVRKSGSEYTSKEGWRKKFGVAKKAKQSFPNSKEAKHDRKQRKS